MRNAKDVDGVAALHSSAAALTEALQVAQWNVWDKMTAGTTTAKDFATRNAAAKDARDAGLDADAIMLAIREVPNSHLAR